jgi:hypothetical protein
MNSSLIYSALGFTALVVLLWHRTRPIGVGAFVRFRKHADALALNLPRSDVYYVLKVRVKKRRTPDGRVLEERWLMFHSRPEKEFKASLFRRTMKRPK